MRRTYAAGIAYLHVFEDTQCARAVIDPTYPDIDMDQFPKQEWSIMYGSDKEAAPGNAPKPIGNEFIIRVYVDASFAGCRVT